MRKLVLVFILFGLVPTMYAQEGRRGAGAGPFVRVSVEPETLKGAPYSADITACARAFGLQAWKVERDEDLENSLKAALESGGPALVEVIVSRDAAGPFATGWWDFPSPAYYEKEQPAYAKMRVLEQHL